MSMRCKLDSKIDPKFRFESSVIRYCTASAAATTPWNCWRHNMRILYRYCPDITGMQKLFCLAHFSMMDAVSTNCYCIRTIRTVRKFVFRLESWVKIIHWDQRIDDCTNLLKCIMKLTAVDPVNFIVFSFINKQQIQTVLFYATRASIYFDYDSFFF